MTFILLILWYIGIAMRVPCITHFNIYKLLYLQTLQAIRHGRIVPNAEEISINRKMLPFLLSSHQNSLLQVLSSLPSRFYPCFLTNLRIIWTPRVWHGLSITCRTMRVLSFE